MWKTPPESSRSLPMLAALALLCGATACGPSNDGGTPATYNIVFQLSQTPASLTALEFTVTYENGNFSGSGTSVACSLLSVANEAAFDDDNVDTLSVVIDAAVADLDDNAEIVECDFVSAVQPTSEDFVIVVEDAEPSDPGDVDVVVSSTELVGEDE